MMVWPFWRLLPLVVLIFVGSCGPASAPEAAPRAGEAPNPAAPPQDRTINIAIEGEPTSIAAVYPSIGGRSTAFQVRTFNAYLELLDARGEAHPYLAEALPVLGTDSWQLFSDGRMQTTYRLKPNLSWHDGTALSAEDFAFAWRLISIREAGFGLFMGSPPFKHMEEVSAPDSRTVVIRWRDPFPTANVLQSGGSRMGLAPFPRHLLASELKSGTFDALSHHPYWTREFIGLGPYRLDRWELGTFMEGVAFDAHVLGRPKISRIRFTFMAEPNAIVAGIRAGAVEIAADALPFVLGLELKREWAASNVGTVLINATSYRSVIFQFRSELVTPRSLLDVRVRRALAHAVDRQSLGEALWAGEIQMLETIFEPTVSYYPTIDRAIVKYPYDLRASERLMAEAGFTKGGDGFYTSPTEGRFTPEIMGGEEQSEHPIMAGTWRQAGLDVREAILPRALARDPEARSAFPSLATMATGSAETNWMAVFTSAQIGTAATRWRGSNRSGWSNPAFDRLVEAFNTTLDPQQRIEQRAEIARMLSAEVPVIMVSLNPNITTHIAALRGLTNAVLGTTGQTAWNIHEWELRL